MKTETFNALCKSIQLFLGILLVGAALGLVTTATSQINKNGDQLTAIGKFVNDDPRGIKGTFSNLNAILLQIGIASDELRRASEKQNIYWDKTGIAITQSVNNLNEVLGGVAQTLGSLNKAAATLDSTIASVREGPVSESAKTLVEARHTLEALRADTEKMINQSTTTIAEAQVTLATTNQILEKSKLAESFNNVSLLTGNLNQAGANVAETTGYIRDSFKPTKKAFWRVMLESVVPIGIKSFIPQRTIIQNTPTVKVENK